MPLTTLHIASYGKDLNTYVNTIPVLAEIDLSDLEPPSRELCYWFTGKDREIQDVFWSHRQHERLYRNFVAKIHGRVLNIPPGGEREWMVLVNCRAGVHRSVAFVERLYEKLRDCPSVRVTKYNKGFERAVEIRRRRWEVEGGPRRR